jgi:organic radical activating enzyme
MNDLEFKHKILDTKSASFCGAKWYNATIWLGSGMSTSCHHPPAHLVDIEEAKRNPKAIHNTPQKKQDRAQMQAGERPPGCEYCWKIEDIKRDNISDRVYKSKIYKIEDLDNAFTTPVHEDVNLKTLEISFDRTCQFACSYCNPAFSSTWVRDIKSNGPYANLQSDGRNHFTHDHNSAQLYKFGETNPYIEAFFKWWESDLHKTLDELRITGGEPLMSGYTWQLLDWFKANKGKSATRLAINSNLGKDVDVDRLLASVDQPIDLYTSNESWATQAEYIRDGLEWDLWIDNMTKLIYADKIRSLHVMCTINALCLESLTEFLDLLVAWKTKHGKEAVSFTLNILRFPSFQSALVFPDEIRNKHKQKLQTWLDYHVSRPVGQFLHEHEINHTKRLIDYLDVVKTPHSDTFDMPRLHNDFKQFYTQYDLRRGKNLVETFPELTEWYNGL